MASYECVWVGSEDYCSYPEKGYEGTCCGSYYKRCKYFKCVNDFSSYKAIDDYKYEVTHSSGCFLTTACVEFMGKEDTCVELETLRAFRDLYLVNTEAGKKIINVYYNEAPRLVQEMKRSENYAEYCEYIYKNISAMIELINNKRFSEAISTYSTMVYCLELMLARNNLEYV